MFDFGELEPNDRIWLRDAVLAHVMRYSASDNQAIPTQLCLSVADLVIQMHDQWPDAVDQLFENLKDNYPLLLDILKYLPEENQNRKLLVDQQKRILTRHTLERKVVDVLNLLHTLWKTDGQTPQRILQKVLDCFYSWLRFIGAERCEENPVPCETLLQVLDPLVLDCFRLLENPDLGETATDIIVEVLRICAINLEAYGMVAQRLMPHINNLETPLVEALQNQHLHEDKVRRLCRIYTETGESLAKLIVDQYHLEDSQRLVNVLLACSNVEIWEISSIALEFWHKLAECVFHHQEPEKKREQFQPVYENVLKMLIHRAIIPENEDPFNQAEELRTYRSHLKQIVIDCTRVLPPNFILEFVISSLMQVQGNPILQEAHFFILSAIGPDTQAREKSDLWLIIQDLPKLIRAETTGTAQEQIRLRYTKRTAMMLLGSLRQWVQQKPEMLRTTFEMISSILLSRDDGTYPGSHASLQEAAAQSFSEVSRAKDLRVMQDLSMSLCKLYQETLITLPTRLHLCVVEGVAKIVEQHLVDEEFKEMITLLVTPLLEALNNPEVFTDAKTVTEILDRLTTIVRYVYQPKRGTARAGDMGALIENTLWPIVQKIFSMYSENSNVVEKTCRLIKHSMRCIPDLFKPIVPQYAEMLTNYFEKKQHSTYLYSADIIVNTYGNDPDCEVMLGQLFNQLSMTALKVLQSTQNLESEAELIEDFFGMINRFLRNAPGIVFRFPALELAMETCLNCIFVQQKDAIDAIISLVESLFDCSQECPPELHQLLFKMSPILVRRIFEMLERVPPSFVTVWLPGLLKVVRRYAAQIQTQDFPKWIAGGLEKLPPSVITSIDNLHGKICNCKDNELDFHINDVAYRCEQVMLRKRNAMQK